MDWKDCAGQYTQIPRDELIHRMRKAAPLTRQSDTLVYHSSVDAHGFYRGLLKINSAATRRARKKQRRYQHQKRKQ
jgi:hypothetical protein